MQPFSTSSSLFSDSDVDINSSSPSRTVEPNVSSLEAIPKAERIIAEIKARAYNEILSSPLEKPPRVFKDALDDSDEEDLLWTPLVKEKQNKRKKKSIVSPAVRNSSRKSKRQRKNCDPLIELLNQKRMGEMNGKSEVALLKAEAAAKAEFAKKEKDRYMGEEFDEGIIDETYQEQLFGEESVKEIGELLKGDRISRKEEKNNAKILGVSLWGEELSYPGDSNNPKLSKYDLTHHNHPLISLLGQAMEHYDVQQTTLLICSGALATLTEKEFSSIINHLFDLALYSSDTDLSLTCLQMIAELWTKPSFRIPGINFAFISSTLLILGAKSAVLANCGWNPTCITAPRKLSPFERSRIVSRLITLLNSATRELRLSGIPDILLALVLIANDPTTSTPHKRRLISTIDSICRSVGPNTDLIADMESEICTKIIQYVTTLEPINQAFIVSLFGFGTGRTKRIARWIAFITLTDAKVVHATDYQDFPNLALILAQLDSSQESHQSSGLPGKFDLHYKPDFVNMSCYIRILGVALTDVPGYVMEEIRIRRCADENSLLSMVRTSIEALHSRILDHRAAHLDRSQVKTALKALSLQVHYQRSSSLKNSRKIDAYFLKKN